MSFRFGPIRIARFWPKIPSDKFQRYKENIAFMSSKNEPIFDVRDWNYFFSSLLLVCEMKMRIIFLLQTLVCGINMQKLARKDSEQPINSLHLQ